MSDLTKIILGILVFTAIISIALVISENNKTKAGIEYTKLGLEECPKFPHSHTITTIWVKDCSVYFKLNEEK